MCKACLLSASAVALLKSLGIDMIGVGDTEDAVSNGTAYVLYLNTEPTDRACLRIIRPNFFQ
jgi:hypothetical protein